MAYMDYMDNDVDHDVHCPKKAIKFNYSLTPYFLVAGFLLQYVVLF